MITRLLLPALALLAAPVTPACEGPAADLAASPETSGDPLGVRSIELFDENGVGHTLGELAPGLARGETVVLSFTEAGCPIASKLSHRLDRLAREYAERGVRFLLVDASSQDSLARIQQESAELERELPVFKDASQELARTLSVRSTTEVFLFDPRGALAYRGALDDQYSLGAARPAPTQGFLTNALQAVLAGRQPEVAETEAPGCLLTLQPEGELSPPVTYSRDVAPILQRRCEGCHRPGQVGPFSLTSFDEAKGRAKMIATVVEHGIMPPWNADERFDGVFRNERRLTSQEKETLLSWVADGMPQGDPKDEPEPLSWPEGWTIGTPDLVLQPNYHLERDEPLSPEGFSVPREGVVDYQHFTVETDFPEDRWIQALEVVPGAADVVHHVLIAIMEKNGSIDPQSYLAVYVPGDTPSIYPEGYAKRLPAGSTLVFQLHYTPNGKERNDLSSVGLVFAKEEPMFEVVTDSVVNRRFEIPPGESHYEVRQTLLLQEDTGVVSLFPHMHVRGKDFLFRAHYPDETTEDLLFSHYDFQWQESYILPDPMLLPAGTTLECIGHFDNSSDNPNNPDPSEAVRWGDQSFEEMFIGYFDKVVPLE